MLDVRGKPPTLLAVISESHYAGVTVLPLQYHEAPEVLPVAADPGAEVRMRPEPGAVTPGVVMTVGNFSNINIRSLQTSVLKYILASP